MLVYDVLIKKLNTDKMTMGYGHPLKCYKFIAGLLVDERFAVFLKACLQLLYTLSQ